MVAQESRHASSEDLEWDTLLLHGSCKAIYLLFVLDVWKPTNHHAFDPFGKAAYYLLVDLHIFLAIVANKNVFFVGIKSKQKLDAALLVRMVHFAGAYQVAKAFFQILKKENTFRQLIDTKEVNQKII